MNDQGEPGPALVIPGPAFKPVRRALSRNHAVVTKRRRGCCKVGQCILPAQDAPGMEPKSAGVSGPRSVRKPRSAPGRLEARPTLDCIVPAQHRSESDSPTPVSRAGYFFALLRSWAEVIPEEDERGGDVGQRLLGSGRPPRGRTNVCPARRREDSDPGPDGHVSSMPIPSATSLASCPDPLIPQASRSSAGEGR